MRTVLSSEAVATKRPSLLNATPVTCRQKSNHKQPNHKRGSCTAAVAWDGELSTTFPLERLFHRQGVDQFDKVEQSSNMKAHSKGVDRLDLIPVPLLRVLSSKPPNDHGINRTDPPAFSLPSVRRVNARNKTKRTRRKETAAALL